MSTNKLAVDSLPGWPSPRVYHLTGREIVSSNNGERIARKKGLTLRITFGGSVGGSVG